MKHFNVRVYGIIIENNHVLISDEYINKTAITKFPGGGLEFGEGTIDCVKREFKEELNLDIEVITHFYTTDFFVSSAFNPQSQVISIYYLVKPLSEITVEISKSAIAHEQKKEGAQTFRWKSLTKISENDFTFAIDKVIGNKLKELL